MKWCRKTWNLSMKGGGGVGLRYLLLLLHYNKPVHTCYICSAGIRNATVMMITQTVTLTVKNNDLTLRLWVRVTCVKLLIYHSLYCENVRIAVWLVRLLSFWCWQKQIFCCLQNDHGSENVTNCELGYQHYVGRTKRIFTCLFLKLRSYIFKVNDMG